MSLATTAVIIPALNEADNLPRLIPGLIAMGIGQVIVGDNGSTDRTAEVAADCGAVVAVEPQRGYGAACWAAMQRLREEVDVVVFLDADLADDHTLLPQLVAPIAAGTHDLVIGARARHLRKPGSMTAPQVFGNWLATRLIRWGWGPTYTDLGPFRAIRRTSLDAIGMRDRAFGWTIEMQIRAAELGLRHAESEIPYAKRRGQSKISGTVKGVILAGYWILGTAGWLFVTKGRRSKVEGRKSKVQSRRS